MSDPQPTGTQVAGPQPAAQPALPKVAAPRPWQRLSVSIIAAMLLMTLIMAVSMVVVSNYSVQRQLAAMPPEWRAQLERERQQDGPPVPQPQTAQRPNQPGQPAQANPPPGQRAAPPLPRLPRLTRAERFRRDLLGNLLWAVAISGTVAVAVGALIARQIARPIDAVSRAAQRVAGGDLTARAAALPSNAEMVNLTRHFNQMAGSLEQLERERRDIIADIAHELRTPLAVVQARLDAFEDGILQPTPQELALIGTQIELLTRLVSDLRTLSLADAGRLTLQRSPLDVSALSGRIAQSYASKASASGRQLLTQLTRHELPVLADRDRLGQILMNLLENAVRYTPKGSTITVSTRQEGEWAVLEVQDNGPGFAPSSLPKLFSRFYRADESRSRESGGSGLGLAIVAALVGAHGGQVSARNAQGGGAQVTVRLPLLAEEDGVDGEDGEV